MAELEKPKCCGDCTWYTGSRKMRRGIGVCALGEFYRLRTGGKTEWIAARTPRPDLCEIGISRSAIIRSYDRKETERLLARKRKQREKRKRKRDADRSKI